VSKFFSRPALTAGAVALALAASTAIAPVEPTFAARSEAAVPAAQSTAQNEATTFSPGEIVGAGQHFFGETTKGLAQAVEYVFSHAGRPSGYIIGEEAAGAFFGGLRYGEGTLFLKNGARRKVYWQGPSVGFDVGGDGARTLVLVYNISSPAQIFDRFVGVEGSAYVIGGLGINFQSNDHLKLAPIRTGVGARLGANFGYLKYTSRPTWNPF